MDESHCQHTSTLARYDCLPVYEQEVLGTEEHRPVNTMSLLEIQHKG